MVLAFAHAAKDAAGKARKLVHRDISPGNVPTTRTVAPGEQGAWPRIRAPDMLLAMTSPTPAQIRDRLRDGFALDRLWGQTMGWPAGDTKEGALRALTALLTSEHVKYAIIGGIAVQIYTSEPRTTRDIDLALASYEDIPRDALLAAGFKHEGRFDHSDNWRAPGPLPRKRRTAVQISVDKLTPGTVERARSHQVLGMRLKVASLPDLLLLKLEAAEEPRRRPSKRQSDLADITRLIEEHPELIDQVEHVGERIARVNRAVAAGVQSLLARRKPQ